jgi:uncharacterized protein (DUF1697 family)
LTATDRQILLLRGINVGPHKRISMPDLRDLLSGGGFENVRTYVQSGNVVLDSELPPEETARECERLIAERFGFEVDVVARTRDEIASVIERNPLADVATDPKRYQVSFLSNTVDPDLVERIAAAAHPDERLIADGLELYAWHPNGVARSKMWTKLAGTSLGVTATARNWTTVTTLLELADGGG